MTSSDLTDLLVTITLYKSLKRLFYWNKFVCCSCLLLANGSNFDFLNLRVFFTLVAYSEEKRFLDGFKVDLGVRTFGCLLGVLMVMFIGI